MESLESRRLLSGVQVTYHVDSDWGSGFQAEVSLNDQTTVAIPAWKLQFNLAANISSIWNAQIIGRSGSQYTITGMSWNGAVPAGGSISFGFVAAPGGVAAPSNYLLNGVPLSNWARQNPVAVPDSAWTYQGQATSVPVLANDRDPNGYPLSVRSFSQGQHGSVVAGTGGALVYTPAVGFTGTDTFAYTIGNGQGGTASASVSVSVAPGPQATWPTRAFAPYVDMTLYPTYNLTAAMSAAGTQYFTLAFVVADPQNHTPSWGGYSTYNVNGGTFDMALRSQVAAVRQRGGDVMVSFGGANGQELAQAITNVKSLEHAYQTVIDAYNLTQVDFDIEGAAAADRASIDRRSQALADLQRQAVTAGKTLNVWLTLPVLPSGLTGDGISVVQSALKYGVKLAGVNIMAMDYGSAVAPNPNQMGQYAIQAAQSLFRQLNGLYGTTLNTQQIWQKVGVTPMIGLNDVTPEVFTLQAAQELTAFAQQAGIGRISMWSLNRDRQNPRGAIHYVEPVSSSLIQEAYAFARIFLTYQKKK